MTAQVCVCVFVPVHALVKKKKPRFLSLLDFSLNPSTASYLLCDLGRLWNLSEAVFVVCQTESQSILMLVHAC